MFLLLGFTLLGMKTEMTAFQMLSSPNEMNDAQSISSGIAIIAVGPLAVAESMFRGVQVNVKLQHTAFDQQSSFFDFPSSMASSFSSRSLGSLT